jgi:hypothetical protein
LSLGVAAAAGIAAAAPNSVAPELRAKKLFIIDDQGKETIRLVTGPHGGAIDVLNLDGRAVFRAGAAEKGGKAFFSDAKGQNNIELSSEEAGGQLLLSDNKGQKNVLKAVAGK